MVRHGGDPVGVPYLDATGVERKVWDHILTRVADEDRAQDARYWRNMFDVVTGGVGKAVSKLFRKF